MKTNKNGEYLYLSTLIPDEEFQKVILLDKSPQIATHNFNWKIFKGIISSKSINCNFHVVSTRPITEYPQTKILIVNEKNWETKYGVFYEVFFINIPILKTMSIFLSSLLKSISWGIRTKNKYKKGVFMDTYQLPYLISGYLISRIYKIPLIGVLTDPPNMNYKLSWESRLKSSFRGVNGSLSNFFIKKYSAVIALTKYLADDYCPNKPQLVIEAIADENERKNNQIKTDKFIIMYSGSLLRVYGIITLIKAFSNLTYPNLELWIFGRGDVEEEINDYATNDLRIKYYGFKPNKEVVNCQSIVNLLVNPRPINLPDSKYSFPSKILEFMQSGTPTLVTRLPGIPDEYSEYVFFFEDDDVKSIENDINRIYNMNKDELTSIGKKAQVFAKSKSIKNQGDKIVNFMQKITSEHSK